LIAIPLANSSTLVVLAILINQVMKKTTTEQILRHQSKNIA